MKKINENQEKKDKKGKVRKRSILLIMLFIILIVMILALKQCGAEVPKEIESENNEFDLTIDENAEESVKDTQAYKDAQDRVNDKIQKMYLNIAINTTPVMQRGTAEGNFDLKNIASNQYIVVADIVEKLNVEVDTELIDFQFKAKDKKSYSENEQKAYAENGTIAYINIEDYTDAEKVKLQNEISKLILNQLGIPENEDITFNLSTIPSNSVGVIYVEHLIYRSKAIPIGSVIKTAKLDYALDKGIHECRVYYNAFDPTTGENIGKCGAEMTLTVKN